MNNLKFRNELIDGLRGYSIILVVLFHLNIKEFHNCFVGVDFTFVLTGYLLTKSSLSNKEDMNLMNYYVKRFYRIFPSYCSVLLIMVIYEIIKGVNEMKYLEEHLYDSVFLSDIYLIKSKEDYFYQIHSSYLIPYWSLSIEIQFYLMFPLLLLLLMKGNNDNLFKIIIIMLLLLSLSLIYEIYNNYMKDSSIYYSFCSRIWEFLLGILVSIYKIENKKMNINIDLLTLILLIIPLINIEMNVTLYRVIELLILVMILQNGEENEVEEKEYNNNKNDDKNDKRKKSVLLENEIIKWIGKHSYILYLIHYPILQSKYDLSVKLLMMLMICIIMYEEIENRIQRMKICNKKKIIIILLFFFLPLIPLLIINYRFMIKNQIFSSSYNNNNTNVENNINITIPISYFKSSSSSSSKYRSIPLHIHTLNKPINYSNVIIYNGSTLGYVLNLEVCNHIKININANELNNQPIAYVIGDSYSKQWMGVIKKYCYERNITLIYTNIQVRYFKQNSIEKLLINKILLYNYHFDMIFISFTTRIVYEFGGFDSMMKILTKLINVVSSFTDEIFVFQGIPFNHVPGSTEVNICHSCLYERREYCYTILGYNESFNPPFPSLSLPNYHLIDFYNSQFCHNNICSCVINNRMVYDTYFHINPFILRLFNDEFSEYMDNETHFKYKKMREYNIKEKKPIFMYGELYQSHCADSDYYYKLLD